MLHAIALFDCVADEEGELSFKEGTRFVDVVDSSEEDWLEGRIEGTSQRGLFPSNYVDVISVPSPTVVKSIPKASTPELSQGNSVSPPNSTISSSWSVIPNAPTTHADNNLTSARSDAFDTAKNGLTSSKYRDIATTLMNKRTIPKPSSVEPQQPLSTTSPMATPNLSDRKPGYPILQQQPQQTRTRSFSASSSTFPRIDHDTTLVKPSTLRQNSGLKTQLDSSPWRSKLDNMSQSSTGSPRRPSLNTITGNKSNAIGNDDEDMEEEDGYQLIKPSQLRKRQQGQLKEAMKSNTVSLSSSVSTSALPTQQKSSKSTRLQTLPSTSTVAKLPSRPVSQANRLSKSRSSSTKSSLPTNTPDTVTTSNSSKIAPTLKPKPAQLNKLPIVTKERSASNPPPIQPKNFTLDTHRLNNKPTIEIKPLFPKSIENGINIGARGGVALPGLGKKNSAPTLPIRPSGTKPADESIFKGVNPLNDDTNLKPSQLLTTQRARSSTNPSFATRPLIDTQRPTNNKSLLTASLDGGAIRSPPPPPSLASKSTTKSSSLPAIATTIKQAPPPPPPSRQPVKSDVRSSRRYDDLFDSIQDDGFVDGTTARLVWTKSRLPNETLASIWQHCDQRKSGLLDRRRFIDGMNQIDAHLARHRSMKSLS